MIYNSGLMPKPYVDRTTRTNNRLIVGPKVDVPAISGLELSLAEVTAAAKTFNYLWTDEQYTASEGSIVIAKGHLVAFRGDDNKLGFADLDAASNRSAAVVGLTYMSLFKPVRGRLAGNRPGIARKGYFELPIFASYADAHAVGHKWGAVIGDPSSTLIPGAYLGACGSATDGADAVGWMKRVASKANAVAQVLEVNVGPTFDGLLEWVTFDNPMEFEMDGDFWKNTAAVYPDGTTTEPVVRDPNSPTGYSFRNQPYDPTLQDPLYRDARGIPNLSDGANWVVTLSQSVVIPNAATGSITLRYYTFGGVGASLNVAESGPAAASADLTFSPALNGATVIDSVTDDTDGTITVVFSAINAADRGDTVTVSFKAKGQVAGVPTNIDIAKCKGFCRFELNVGLPG